VPDSPASEPTSTVSAPPVPTAPSARPATPTKPVTEKEQRRADQRRMRAERFLEVKDPTALGNPVAMHSSPGQAHDSKHALDVIGDLRPEVVALDKTYDSEPLMDELRSRGDRHRAVHPAQKNRKRPRACDRQVYWGRSCIEQTFHLMKKFCWIVTRYGKSSRNYHSMASFAGMTI